MRPRAVLADQRRIEIASRALPVEAPRRTHEKVAVPLGLHELEPLGLRMSHQLRQCQHRRERHVFRDQPSSHSSRVRPINSASTIGLSAK